MTFLVEIVEFCYDSCMTAEEIQKRLEIAYPSSKIEVTDFTGGGDHYQVFIESCAFAGQSRIQQHKSVMQVFDDELKSGEVHALTIKTKVKEG